MKRNKDSQKDLKKFTLDREEEILKKYQIDNINDSINVQKNILSKLKETNFYQVVVNDETGMIIELTKSGIKETFGYANYLLTPRFVKLLKVDLLEQIPQILKTGHLDVRNYSNYHKDNSELEYNYLNKKIDYYGYVFTVRCDIRKSNIKNQFWMHQIIFDIKK